MPKYRLLSSDELQAMEKEFIEFLILNGITADEWKKIIAEDTEKAERFVALFSDVVWEGILRKIKFLEMRGNNFLHIYQCLAQELVLVAMECEDEGVNFLNPDFIKSAMLTPPEKINVYTSTRQYKDSREVELFDFLQKGAIIADDRLFKILCLQLQK
ncbi:MAG: DUF6495 family protein [Cytophagaceae bacterium]|jgi:hypothetical protein|nr:DUF6495 family protein [Cytophagaceae bacterium]